jgi:hypothetical protein
MDQNRASGAHSAPSKDRKPSGEGKRSALRRSQRVSITVPVLVYGKGKDGRPFREETNSLVVNAHGGLILLASPVELKQELLLINPKTTQEVSARVAYLGRRENGKSEIGVGFTEPSPRFWHINFPPEDWDPSERKLPSSTPSTAR